MVCLEREITDVRSRSTAHETVYVVDFVANDVSSLYHLDVASGRATQIGRMTTDVTDMAFDGPTHYGVRITEDESSSQLFTVDLRDGRTTMIGDLGQMVDALVAHEGRLYGIGGSAVVEINPSDGTTSPLAIMGLNADDDDDDLHVLAIVKGQADKDFLAKINLSTGATKLIGETGVPRIFCIDYYGNGMIGVTGDGTVVQVRPDTGQATLITETNPPRPWSGICVCAEAAVATTAGEMLSNQAATAAKDRPVDGVVAAVRPPESGNPAAAQPTLAAAQLQAIETAERDRSRPYEAGRRLRDALLHFTPNAVALSFLFGLAVASFIAYVIPEKPNTDPTATGATGNTFKELAVKLDSLAGQLDQQQNTTAASLNKISHSLTSLQESIVAMTTAQSVAAKVDQDTVRAAEENPEANEQAVKDVQAKEAATLANHKASGQAAARTDEKDDKEAAGTALPVAAGVRPEVDASPDERGGGAEPTNVTESKTDTTTKIDEQVSASGIQPYDAAVLADQPFAYWKLDETSGTTVADATGNGNEGDIHGGVTLGQPGAIAGSTAPVFDGSTGYLEFGGIWGGGEEATVEAWVKVSQTSDEFQAVVSALGEEFVQLQLHSSGNINVYTDTGTAALPIVAQTPTGAWRHVALVVASGESRVYVDGKEVGGSDATFLSVTATPIIRIGSGLDQGRFFRGQIDRVAIYEAALSPEQVQAHFTARGKDDAPSNPATAPAEATSASDPLSPTAYDEAVLEDKPFAYWKLDETSGTTVADATGNENEGDIHGSVTLGQPGAIAGSTAPVFDGSTGYLEFGGVWGGGEEATVEAWVKVSQTSDDFQAVVSALGEEFVQLQLHSSGNINVYTDTGTAALPIMAQTPTGAWRHVALVVASGESRVYVDGKEVGGSDATFLSVTATPMIRIGSELDGRRFFKGQIDRVAIYEVALSLEQIQVHLKAAGKGATSVETKTPPGGGDAGASTATPYDKAVLEDKPFAYWKLDETSGTTVADATGNENEGNVHGGVTLGQPGAMAGSTAPVFDGSTGYLEFGGFWGGGEEATVEAWVKVSQTSDEFQAVVSALGEEFVQLQLHSSGNINVYTDTGTASLPIVPQTPTGAWRHVALVVASGESRVYVDGKEVGGSDATFSSVTATSMIRIGSGLDGGRFFRGQIDRVAIYEAALSLEQVQTHFKAAGKTVTSAAVAEQDTTGTLASRKDPLGVYIAEAIARRINKPAAQVQQEFDQLASRRQLSILDNRYGLPAEVEELIQFGMR